MKWLLVTVGGSCQPIVRSIQTLQPERTVFVCSWQSMSQIIGDGKVCSSSGGDPDLPSIPAQLDLTADRYELTDPVEPDDPSNCYQVAMRAIDDIRRRDTDARLFVAYTGGSKSMSAMLAAAALDAGNAELCLVTGFRPDLKVVRDGTEALTRVRVEAVVLHRVRAECDSLLAGYHYRAAEAVLTRYLVHSPACPDARKWVAMCRGFDAWDRFDHRAAMDLLQATGCCTEHLGFLGRVTKSDDKAWKSPAGYLLALDLLANAERRAAQGRYDDASGRHYRAAEMVAQTFLWGRRQLDTARVPADRLPADMQRRLRPDGDNTVKLGVSDAWQLAASLDSDLKAWFKEWERRLKDALKLRNYSLFAHGTTPVTQQCYRKDVEEGVAAFARSALDHLKSRRLAGDLAPPPPFPTSLPQADGP